MPKGPFLNAAFFCEMALIENSGDVSFIRLVQSFSLDASRTLPAVIWPTLALVFSGEAAHGAVLEVAVIRPSGETYALPAFPLTVTGAGPYNLLASPLEMAIPELGMYALEIRLQGTHVSSIFLEVRQEKPGPLAVGPSWSMH